MPTPRPELPVLTFEQIADEPSDREVLSREQLYRGPVQTVVRERFNLDSQTRLERDYVEHPGAVVVAALNERGELLMIRQYRHPVRMLMWELPAGLLDVPGESPNMAARRELAEEADLQASSWKVLVDLHNSAGGSTEATRIFLAQNLSEVPEDQRHQREAEEAEMETAWVPLPEALRAVLEGKIHNAGAVAGILALNHKMNSGDSWQLRSEQAPWDEHPASSTWA